LTTSLSAHKFKDLAQTHINSLVSYVRRYALQLYFCLRLQVENFLQLSTLISCRPLAW